MQVKQSKKETAQKEWKKEVVITTYDPFQPRKKKKTI
jgi:hypothetical protein